MAKKAANNAVKARELALEALSHALAEPEPRPLHGTKAKPGMFSGSSIAAKAAAQLSLDNAWFAPTGEFQGTGKARKPLYQITSAGITEIIENGSLPLLLKDMLAGLDRTRESLHALKCQLEDAGNRIEDRMARQRAALEELRQRCRPPNLDAVLRTLSAAAAAGDNGWLERAQEYLRDYKRRHPYGNCSLPELYHCVAEPLSLSIGQFHDGLRALAAEGRIRLHAFSGAAYQLEEEQYALVAGQEIKYYVEPIAA